ncbi:LuxR C-terminal-related transcriptional regulator [Rubripirellula obstinata]|nr:response regulator transcription factor [Rubripirellula obstinata]
MPTRILLWDQREIIRAGIKSICCQHDDLQVVGETASQESAIELAQHHCPDVVIVEMSSVEGPVQQVFQRLVATNPQQNTKILVLAEENQVDVAIQMPQAGASGYLTHHSSLEEIVVAIRCIAKGRIFISHSHAATPAPKIKCDQIPSFASTITESSIDLSAREREVLSLISEGMTNKQAAEKLFLSVKTVETYRSRIMKKHGLKDRLALFKFAASIEALKEEQLSHC